jgi:hypothetical protein
MAAVEVTISGVLYDKISRSTRPVVLIGEASLTGLEIGGGPIPPGSPPGIWGPTDPRPGGGPIIPPGSPPGIWGPTDPRPTPPINLPPEGPPTEPPTDGADKPPPEDGGWGFVAEWTKWGYFPAPGEAQPKEAAAPATHSRRK